MDIKQRMEEADGNGVIMPPGDICHYFQAFMGFPGGSAGNESTCNVGDLGSIPGLGRSPGEGKGYLLQYSGVHAVTMSRT